MKLYQSVNAPWIPLNYGLPVPPPCPAGTTCGNLNFDRAGTATLRAPLIAELSFDVREDTSVTPAVPQLVPITMAKYEIANGKERRRYVFNFLDNLTGPLTVSDFNLTNAQMMPLGNYISTTEFVYVQDALKQAITFDGDTLNVKSVTQYQGVVGKEQIVSVTNWKLPTAPGGAHAFDTRMLADVNNDGVVNNHDLFLFTTAFNNLVVLNRDLNGDGLFNAEDARILEQAVLALENITTTNMSALLLDRARGIDFNNDGQITLGEVEFFQNVLNSFVDVNLDGVVDGSDIMAVNNVLGLLAIYDTDGDSFSDLTEAFMGTDPTVGIVSPDSDGDGIADAIEIARGSDEFDSSETPDNVVDSDNDGVGDKRERRLHTNPFDPLDHIGNFIDSDLDGYSDSWETHLIPGGNSVRTNPKSAFDFAGVASDSDGDGFSDLYERELGTNPFDGDDNIGDAGYRDTDLDGVSDSEEKRLKTDWQDQTDFPGRKVDTDGDGYSDLLELRVGSNPFDDADGPNADLITLPA